MLLLVAVLSFGVWQWQQTPPQQIIGADVGVWSVLGKAQSFDDND
jgi:hypothetical protein